MKKYYKNKCNTVNCKNSSDNAVLIKIKNKKMIVQLCTSCKYNIKKDDEKKFNENDSLNYNFCPILDQITIIHASSSLLEMEFSEHIADEMRIYTNRIKKSINQIVEHVSEFQTPVKD
ncbi:MAG: hypothetical protein COA77_10695 [Thaumarchaeota archaeon]|nr:MAG: hypothetical protein COA77_10695 [Nitrososphaerota archaeon]